ncbi:hypothetical protein M9Y10_034007 [Tritrichomonas musculus]|uniref:Uncharacterized protein n=1 Tax=Tritrichomonas musculus TaxID=1915356 RepID=A0ABR2KEG8_9EUKA
MYLFHQFGVEGNQEPNQHTNQFHLVNVEPYTSEMYSALLQPSMQILEKNYAQYGKKQFTKENFIKSLVIAPIKGIAFGINRSVISVAFHNINQDYQDTPDPKPPKDIFFLKYYTNVYNYPQMLRGLKTELKVELTYQIYKSYITTFSKYLIFPKGDNLMTNLGFTFARSFTSNLIAATTIYPLALSRFTDKDSEEIIHKVTKRAGSGSVVAGLISSGISVLRSLLPSKSNLISFARFLVGV